MVFNNEDILTLAKAGFTAQQIAALNQIGAAAAPTVGTTPQLVPDASITPAPVPAITPAPAPAPAPAPTPDQVGAVITQPAPLLTPPAPTPAPAPSQGATVDDILKSVKDLTATFQNGFIVGSQQPKPVTAEDILANIINPPSLNTNKEE